MPRVNSAMKNRAGKKIKCGRCGKEIKPGDKYFYFTFRYGGKHIRCAEHYPRPSELTQSKMSGVYAAVEGVEDTIAEVRAGKSNIEDLAGALESAADDVDSVKDEYQEGLDNMPDGLRDAAYETEDKINELESFAETLRGAAEEVREAETDNEDEQEDAIENTCGIAENALGELSL